MISGVFENSNKTVHYKDLGLIDYKEAWDLQTSIFEGIIAEKVKNRSRSKDDQVLTSNYILCCQHPHVYTLGKSGKLQHLLISDSLLAARKASFYEINRGGDITYHGPGQLVVYPILDLENFFTDIHRYMRYLEEAVIRTIQEYGVSVGRVNGLTGVWVGHAHEPTARKICAMGVKTSRWVSMHGLALNVNTDLSFFEHIVPCGISDKAVTSLDKEIGEAVNIKEIEKKLLYHLSEIFQMEIIKDVEPIKDLSDEK